MPQFTSDNPKVKLLIAIRSGRVFPTAEELLIASSVLIECALSGECQEPDGHKRELDEFERRIKAIEEKK